MSLPSRSLLFCGIAWILAIPTFAIPHGEKTLPSIRATTDHPLVVTLKSSSAVTDVAILTIVVKNDGPDDISVVKDPAGPLYDTPMNVWDWKLQNADSEATPEFIGRRVSWSMGTFLDPGPEIQEKDIPNEDAEDSGSESGSVSDSGSESSESESEYEGIDVSKPYQGTTLNIASGDTKEFQYNVGDAYDFRRSGAGTYEVDLRKKRIWFINRKTNKLIKANISINSARVQIGKTLSKFSSTQRREQNQPVARPVSKRGNSSVITVKTKNCNMLRKATIQYSAKKADQYVEESQSYLAPPEATKGARYSWWFGDRQALESQPPGSPLGTESHFARQIVIETYDKMRELPFTSPDHYVYNCDCDLSISVEVRNWAPKGDEEREIFLCKGFWALRKPFVGSYSRAGTLVHEGTHFKEIADTQDYEYDPDAVHQLAVNTPLKAIRNANNYRFFSENTARRS